MNSVMRILMVLVMVMSLCITNFGNEDVTLFATGKDINTDFNSLPARVSYDVNSSTYSINSKSNIEVDKELHQYFTMKIDGQADVYAFPRDNAKINSNFVRPESFTTNDFNIYNDHFIKINDNGYSFYVNINDVKYDVYTNNDKIRLIGDNIVYAVRNPSMDIRTRTYLTAGEIDEYLGGTGLYGIGQAVVECEHKYGLNALFIIAVAIEESGWGSSYLARTRNNLFGLAAYDSDTDAAFSFASKAACIDYFCRLITKEYFPLGRTDVYSISTMYCSSSHWATNINRNMANMINHIK